MSRKDLSKLSDQELIRYRREIEEQSNKFNILQLALKVQLNSAYGALGNKYFRFYDSRQAEAITLSGQMIAMVLEERINDVFNKILNTDGDWVIAMDTDSWYLNLGEIVKKIYPDNDIEKVQEIVTFVDKLCSTKIQKIFDDNFQKIKETLNTPKNTMKVKREVIANKGVWTAKKRYMLNAFDKEGVRFQTPKILIKGLEAIKSSTPEECKIAIRDVFYLILNSTEVEVQRKISEFREKFHSLPPEMIADHKSVSFLDKYEVEELSSMPKGVPQNSKAALAYNFLLELNNLQTKYTKIYEKDKISIVLLKTPNPWGISAIAFPDVLPKEFDLHDYIDYSKQFDKVFLDPIKRILNVIGWSAVEENSLYSLMV